MPGCVRDVIISLVCLWLQGRVVNFFDRGLERLEWNETTRGRSFHSRLFASILNFQATEHPTRTESNPTDFWGGTAQLDPKTGGASPEQRALLTQRTTLHANIPQGKPQNRRC